MVLPAVSIAVALILLSSTVTSIAYLYSDQIPFGFGIFAPDEDKNMSRNSILYDNQTAEYSNTNTNDTFTGVGSLDASSSTSSSSSSKKIQHSDTASSNLNSDHRNQSSRNTDKDEDNGKNSEETSSSTTSDSESESDLNGEAEDDSNIADGGVASNSDGSSSTSVTYASGRGGGGGGGGGSPDNNKEKSTKTVADKIQPSVTITSPTAGDSVESGIVVVEGIASDTGGSGVAKVEVKTNYSSYELATPYEPGNWSLWTISLYVDQPSEIVARSIDAAGNQALHSVIVSLAKSDTTSPEITITTPKDGDALLLQQPVTINGIASDLDSGINKVEVKFWDPINNAGTDFITASSSDMWASWSATVIPTDPNYTRLIAQAIDNAGNVKQLTLEVEYSNNNDNPSEEEDLEAPTIVAPPDLIADASGLFTNLDLGDPTVSDNVDPSPVVSNNAPADGFVLGTTLVTWTATDIAGNSASAVQNITIVDTTAPSITAPPDISKQATGDLTLVSSLGSPTISDNYDTSLTVTNNAPSNGTYPIGTTLVTWTVRDDSGNTSIATQKVTITANDTSAPIVTASPSGATYGTSKSVTLSANEPGTIYYSIDGSTPTISSLVYSSSISITTNTTLKFIGIDVAGNISPVSTEIYIIDTVVPMVTAAPAEGTYSSTQSVILTASEPATIYYTINGNTPTTSSAVYDSSILISSNVTLKYFAKDTAGNSGIVATQLYTIDKTAPIATASPTSGIYSSAQSVTLSSNELGATIYYTTNGQTPTTSSSIYESPITISATTDLKFYAADVAGNSGTVVSMTYTIDTSTPSVTAVSHSPTDPNSDQTVTFTINASDDTSLSSIEIFVDGSAIESCSASGKSFTCSVEAGPYAGGSSHTYYAKVTDSVGKTISSSTHDFSIQSSQAKLQIINSALFRPGNTEEVNQETYNIYASFLTSNDQIGTYQPIKNWKYVKQLADLSGAEIYIGYAAFLNSGSNVQSKWPGTKWVMFDIEGDPYSDPIVAQQAVQEASTKVRNAGLKLIVNVGDPTSHNESNIKEFSKVADGMVIQVMGVQYSPAKFQEFVVEKVGWARSANPDIPIIIGPSVAIRGTNDEYREPSYVYDLVEPVIDKIDGVHFFYGTPESGTTMETLPRLRDMMELLYHPN